MLSGSLDAIVEDGSINGLLALVGRRGKGLEESWCHVERTKKGRFGYIK